jgi:hypothetical protein
MQVSYKIVDRNVTVQMSFDKMREMFVQAGECKMWNWDKLQDALSAGFTVMMPLGVEVKQA